MEDAVKRVRIAGRTNLRPFQLEQIAGACELQVFDTRLPMRAGGDDVVRRAGDAEILVVDAFTPVNATVVRQLPCLRTIVSCSSDIHHVDLEACGQLGVNVRWFPGYCSRALAEKAITYLLMGLTRVLPAIDDVRAGGWDYFGFQSREIPGRRVTVLGYGTTGRIVYDLCRNLGFTVTKVTSATRASDVQAVLRDTDALTMHMDLNPRTTRFLDRATLALLKEDVVIVNNASGGLIDDRALAEWLAGHPAAAAFLDVVSTEPPPADHPYRHLPNVTITPHVGWNSAESDAYLAKETFDAVMTAIESGWTTAAGEVGRKLLLQQNLTDSSDDG
jgi:phosphoglycerate dehydrogenase-like enzyme